MSFKKNNKSPVFYGESVFKVVKLLFDKPNTVFHLRGLAKETGLSTTAVTRVIKALNDILRVEKTAITTNVRVNLESKAYPMHKIVFNLCRLERCGIISTLEDKYQAKAIVLFGSYAKGEDVEQSDVDILVITNHKDIDLSKYVSDWEKSLNRTINLHILSSLERSSSEFRNAVANGIVLHGYIKVI